MRSDKDNKRVWLSVSFIVLVVVVVIMCIITFFAANGPEMMSVGRPAAIIVYSDGASSEYREGDGEYEIICKRLSHSISPDVLETAVLPDMIEEQMGSKAIEFAYDWPQHVSIESNEHVAIVREYDSLLFCFSGSLEGQVALGVEGEYRSGTYRIEGASWPL